MNLTWMTRPGKYYRIHYSPIVTGTFAPVSTNILATGAGASYTHRPPAGTPLGFYRAEEIP